MSSSELKRRIYYYLGFRRVGASRETDEQIGMRLEELQRIAQFRCLYRCFEDRPAFLQKPPYERFLKGCGGVILSVTTLGAAVDRRIKQLGRTDMLGAVVLDACASAYLEEQADLYEQAIRPGLTPRFCPGYGGSTVEDLRPIFALLRPEKIGVSLNESCFMLPAKSMAGVLGIRNEEETQ